MWNVVSAVGNAVYKTAAYTGLAAGTEQPPYPCAWPLQRIEDPTDAPRAAELADDVFRACKDMLADKAWAIVDYRDPDAASGGDLYLYTKPHVGPFNFARATMSLRNCTPEKVTRVLHAPTLAERKRYSADLTHYEVLARPSKDTHLEVAEYWAPPPVAGRDFVFLVSRRYDAEEDTHYVFGCSVDFAGLPARNNRAANANSAAGGGGASAMGTVRGTCMWVWEMTPLGGNTLVTYASCMNPRGWTPTFVIGWLKTEIAKELRAARAVLYGTPNAAEQITATKTTMAELGVTEEDVRRAASEQEKAEEAEAAARESAPAAVAVA